MTEEKTTTETRGFEPITTQEEFDERIKARLAREREKWEKSGGVAELQARVQELERRYDEALETHRQHATRRELDAMLERLNIHGARADKVRKYVDLDGVQVGEDGNPNISQIHDALRSLHTAAPEMFGEDVQRVGGPSGALRLKGSGLMADGRPYRTSPDASASRISRSAPLTREAIENMKPEDIVNRPGLKERVNEWLETQGWRS